MDYDEAKADALCLYPAQVNASRVAKLANRATAEAGFVLWDAQVPPGMSYALHKETFADTLYLALGFCGTRFRHEWLVLGIVGAVCIRSLYKFREAEGIVCLPTPLIFIGHFGIVPVYMNAELPHDEFLAGLLRGPVEDAKLCCRGQIQNLHEGLFVRARPEAEPVPEGINDTWAALGGAVNRENNENDEKQD